MNAVSMTGVVFMPKWTHTKHYIQHCESIGGAEIGSHTWYWLRVLTPGQPIHSRHAQQVKHTSANNRAIIHRIFRRYVGQMLPGHRPYSQLDVRKCGGLVARHHNTYSPSNLSTICRRSSSFTCLSCKYKCDSVFINVGGLNSLIARHEYT